MNLRPPAMPESNGSFTETVAPRTRNENAGRHAGLDRAELRACAGRSPSFDGVQRDHRGTATMHIQEDDASIRRERPDILGGDGRMLRMAGAFVLACAALVFLVAAVQTSGAIEIRTPGGALQMITPDWRKINAQPSGSRGNSVRADGAAGERAYPDRLVCVNSAIQHRPLHDVNHDLGHRVLW